MDHYQQAIEQLAAYGLRVDVIDTSGKLQRVPVDGDKGRKKSGWYVAHEFTLNNGRTVIVGRFGNWKNPGDPIAFEADFSFTEEDKKALQKKQAAVRKHIEAERKRAAADAARRARRMYESAHDTGSHDYLKRKGVRGYWVAYLRDLLLIPVRTVTGELVGLQVIRPDGDKKFITGTPKTGAFHVIGAGIESEVMLIAEGYATAATLHEATGLPCLVAFDAGNLKPVAEAWHARYPAQRIVIAADDDHATDNNPGLTKGKAAAVAVGGQCIAPVFEDRESKTDFNDMHAEQGIEAVRVHVMQQLDHAPVAAPEAAELPPLDSYETETGANEPPPADSGDDTINPERDLNLNALLRDFVVLHGTGGGVFDDRRCEFMSVSDFRTSVGSKMANAFLNHENRRVIFRRNVVFDPKSTTLPKTHINLFRGLPLEPKPGKCELLLDLLFHLCEARDDVLDWVLKWIAYPLQNPGAKMTTAVVIHGREGAGKNLFWSAIQRIYGDYTSIITQNDLESSFNGWASRKLFVIGNEVVSRQEMFHKKGIMKNMITEPEWNINEKNINQRKEANHANFVFFSNFLQPVTPDKDDRRYLVLWTPPKKEKEYYKAAAKERDNGGTEALYHYLLNYDLGEFDEYTEPLLTDAKQDLIELSMKSDERFIDKWLYGDLPVPVGPVLTRDLYRAYMHWCRREGEKFFVSATEFGTLINKHELIEKRADQRYIRGSGYAKGTFAVPHGYEAPADATARNWLGECNEAFNNDYETWLQEDQRS